MGIIEELTTTPTDLQEPGTLEALMDFITSVSPSAAMFTLSVGVLGVSTLALYLAIVALKKGK